MAPKIRYGKFYQIRAMVLIRSLLLFFGSLLIPVSYAPGDEFMDLRHAKLGAWVKPTLGEIWPKPTFQITNNRTLILDSSFKFEVGTTFWVTKY